jgi:uncharacterized membrane protein
MDFYFDDEFIATINSGENVDVTITTGTYFIEVFLAGTTTPVISYLENFFLSSFKSFFNRSSSLPALIFFPFPVYF